MNIDAIKNGIVIDHIQAGKAMQIYNMLNLDELDCSVAIIKNVPSHQMGKKDIIKIDSNIDVNMDVLGFVSPSITVNIIRDSQIVDKTHIGLPERLVNILRCKNPRCITTTEQAIQHIFKLTDPKKIVYRCVYCDMKAK